VHDQANETYASIMDGACRFLREPEEVVAAAISRLQEDRLIARQNIENYGYLKGRSWALHTASAHQLERLHAAQPEFFETNDAHGAPGVFLAIVNGPDGDSDRSAINALASDLEIAEELLYQPTFWQHFAEGAMTVWNVLQPLVDAA
jgi:hypothetical protein